MELFPQANTADSRCQHNKKKTENSHGINMGSVLSIE